MTSLTANQNLYVTGIFTKPQYLLQKISKCHVPLRHRQPINSSEAFQKRTPSINLSHNLRQPPTYTNLDPKYSSIKPTQIAKRTWYIDQQAQQLTHLRNSIPNLMADAIRLHLGEVKLVMESLLGEDCNEVLFGRISLKV